MEGYESVSKDEYQFTTINRSRSLQVLDNSLEVGADCEYRHAD